MQMQLALGSLDHTVYFRNRPHEILQLKKEDFLRVNSLYHYCVLRLQTRDSAGCHGDRSSVLWC